MAKVTVSENLEARARAKALYKCEGFSLVWSGVKDVHSRTDGSQGRAHESMPQSVLEEEEIAPYLCASRKRGLVGTGPQRKEET